MVDLKVEPLVHDQSKLAELLIQVARGDDTALKQVYVSTSGKLNALLIRILRDEQTAEEVLQEVFLTVWTSSGTFDPARGTPMTWLVTIARNRAIDRLRTERSQRSATVLTRRPCRASIHFSQNGLSKDSSKSNWPTVWTGSNRSSELPFELPFSKG
jgi:DNA-directed RNA polymerase specialized sigma24 family protein